MNCAQSDSVQRAFRDIEENRQTLLGHVELLRDQLTSRDANLRTESLNDLCVLLMKLESSHSMQLDSKSIDFLLDFLLSKVEDTGHLCDHLISAIRMLLFKFDSDHPLSIEQSNRVLTSLFEENGVQSYGQKDRLHLFATLEHLLCTHSDQLNLFGPQRLVLLFIRSAQGEREPKVLMNMLRLHRQIASSFKMGVLVEDMFELVACYFPIEYEPSEQDKGKLSREMLRHGLECSLLAHPSFAPFCIQLVVDKLLETEDEGTGDHVQRQLEICSFLMFVCEKFVGTLNKDGSAVGNACRPLMAENVPEDLMTGFRMIFMNPALNNRSSLVVKAREIVRNAAHAIANALERENEAEKAEPLLRQMAVATLENIEPFILQAEMGTMGRAFNLLQCVAESTPICQMVILPKTLYWLNILLRGTTLRSAQNKMEIATEALEFLPFWLRFCYQYSVFDRNNGFKKFFETDVLTLLAELFSLEGICEQPKLLLAKCSSLSALLLPLYTSSSSLKPEEENIEGEIADNESNITYKNILTGNERLRQFCTDTFSSCFQCEFPPNEATFIKQFLALFSLFNSEFVDQFISNYQDHQQFPTEHCHLLPALVCPIPSEFDDDYPGRDQPRLSKPNADHIRLRLKAITGLISNNWIKRAGKAIEFDKLISASLVSIAQRLILLQKFVIAGCHINMENCWQFFDEFLENLKAIVEKLLSTFDEKNNSNEIVDVLAVLLQDISSLLLDPNNLLLVVEERANARQRHAVALCDWATGRLSAAAAAAAIDHCTVSPRVSQLECNLRTYWLISLQSNHFNHLNALQECLLKLANFQTNNIVTKNWLQKALLTVHFAFTNRFEGAEADKERQKRKRILMDAVLSMNIIDGEEEKEAVVEFAFDIVETRSLLLALPDRGSDRLRQLLERFIAFAARIAHSAGLHLSELLDLNNCSTNPEKCDYRRTLFWKQRFFCQFAPIYTDVYNGLSTSHVDRRQHHCSALLSLLGPLLQLAQQIPIETLMDELTQMIPIAVHALGQTLHSSQTENAKRTIAGEYEKELIIRILDGINVLIGKDVPLEEQLLVQLVCTLTDALILNQQPMIALQLKLLSCLGLLTHQRQGLTTVRKIALAKLHGKVVKACTTLAASPKRVVRQRAANVRNGWELLLTISSS